MFRLSQFLRELDTRTSTGPRRNPPGPVVIWNLIRRCNLTCKHCYALAVDKDFPGELDTAQVFDVLDDLKAARVPALILSGGEPLLRPDIFDISARARAMGFAVALSTNGTLIDDAMADRIAEAQYGYVGISIDGTRPVHDKFRRLEGAYDASIAALRRCRDRGLKVGLRFTLTQDNAADFPAMLKLMDDEGIDRFYLSHLNYAGRGNHNRRDDAHFALTRDALDHLFEKALADHGAGLSREYVTGNNDADGPYFLHWVERRFPGAADHIRAKLVQWGGNASGVNVANIDNVGNVHPDTMWWHHTVGNVKDRPFGEIWNDLTDPLMAGLKAHPRAVGGRCAACRYLAVCNGNSRVRADQVSGDPWAEDPGCYLDDAEIGVAGGPQRLAVTSFSGQRLNSAAE